MARTRDDSSETDTYQNPIEDPGIDREENEIDSGIHESATQANSQAHYPHPRDSNGKKVPHKDPHVYE